jgi:tRNA U55 pseudouridine synthase TruB
MSCLEAVERSRCHFQPLFCQLVRIGSYRAVVAEALLTAEPAAAAEPNVLLYRDRLELELRGLPKLVLHQGDIRQVHSGENRYCIQIPHYFCHHAGNYRVFFQNKQRLKSVSHFWEKKKHKFSVKNA